jgi:hypothetical protein
MARSQGALQLAARRAQPQHEYERRATGGPIGGQAYFECGRALSDPFSWVIAVRAQARRIQGRFPTETAGTCSAWVGKSNKIGVSNRRANGPWAARRGAVCVCVPRRHSSALQAVYPDVKGGQDCRALTSHIDITPTLLAMAGIDATKRTEIAGRDLPGKDLDHQCWSSPPPRFQNADQNNHQKRPRIEKRRTAQRLQSGRYAVPPSTKPSERQSRSARANGRSKVRLTVGASTAYRCWNCIVLLAFMT